MTNQMEAITRPVNETNTGNQVHISARNVGEEILGVKIRKKSRSIVDLQISCA